MQALDDHREVDRVLAKERVVIFKHSTRCPLSSFAYREVSQFATTRKDVSVYVVDVIACRTVSQYIAQRCDVRHASPQAILLKQGTVHWHDSHGAVQKEAMEKAVEG